MLPRPRVPFPSLVAQAARACWFGFVLVGVGGLETAMLGASEPHWAFKPLAKPSVPVSPFRHPVDAFLLGSTPAEIPPEADRRTLLRRLSFDLRGLPPSPDELAAFEADSQPDAYERQVERYLASPAYGERWGRHWLDWTAYADSNGYFNADSDRPLAWKYRDYVVRSIQADKPLDQFIREQVAGDELVGFVSGGDVLPGQVDALIATHFWRNVPDGSGESDGNPLEVKVDKYAVLEGNVQLIGSAFLGLTLQCARCHSHKFEPVTQQEYYGLQAILRPALDPDHWLKPNERTIEIGTRQEREAHHARRAAIDRDLKSVQQGLDGVVAPFRKQLLEERIESLPKEDRAEVKKGLDQKEADRSEAVRTLLKKHASVLEFKDEAVFQRFPVASAASAVLREARQKLEAERPAPLEKIALLAEGAATPPVHHLLVRGNHAQEGEAIEPTVPRAIAPEASCAMPASGPNAGSTTGRRLALARWLTDTKNPLPLRVLINRVWQAHFGKGLSPSTDNLGMSGPRPSEEERLLLDWLAANFRDNGWSLKQLHRTILTSASYRASSSRALADLRRLDAESLRDAMLVVTGELDPKLGGPYVPFKTAADGQIVIDESKPGAARRSLYLQHRRTMPVEMLATFNGPSHNPVCIQRIPSTVAQQSLMLLNSEFIRTRARAFAGRILSLAGSPPAESGESLQAWSRKVFELASELAYARPARPEEMEAAVAFVEAQRRVLAGKPESGREMTVDLCQMILASNAFLYVD